MKQTNSPDRISQIAAEMAAITEFAVGSISSSSNTYRLRDGTLRKTKPHYKFQSLGARGKRKYKNIPAKALPRVRKLIKNGLRFKELEEEFIRLVTNESLDASIKKRRKTDPSATAPRQRHQAHRRRRAQGQVRAPEGVYGFRPQPEGRRLPHWTALPYCPRLADSTLQTGTVPTGLSTPDLAGRKQHPRDNAAQDA